MEQTEIHTRQTKIEKIKQKIKRYFLPEKEEIEIIIKISIVLGLIFSFTLKLYHKENNFVENTLLFTIYIFTLFYIRNILTKYISYRNGFKLIYKKSYFNRYGFRIFDRISYYKKYIHLKDKRKGIEFYLLTLLVYILTAFIIIFPFTWRYKTKIIKHKFIGTKQKFDKGFYYYMVPQDITRYRYGKTLFISYIYYALIGIILKSIYSATINETILHFLIITYYIAITTLIPLIGTEGYEVYHKSRSAWFCTLTFLLTALTATLLLNNLINIIIFTIIGFIILFIFLFWKKLLYP